MDALLTAASMVCFFWARLRKPSESTILFVKANAYVPPTTGSSALLQHAYFLMVKHESNSLDRRRSNPYV